MNEIRIDDLADPVLTDLQRGALDYGERQHIDLTVDTVPKIGRASCRERV